MSKLSYPEIWQRAADSPKGIRMEFSSSGARASARQMLYKVRLDMRMRNKKVFDPAHPLHGKSEFDHLFLSNEDVEGKFFIRIAPPGQDDSRITEIE